MVAALRTLACSYAGTIRHAPNEASSAIIDNVIIISMRVYPAGRPTKRSLGRMVKKVTCRSYTVREDIGSDERPEIT
jgi:hypothetical protein